jgi:hypothetical protein
MPKKQPEFEVVWSIYRGRRADVLHEPNLETVRVNALCEDHGQQTRCLVSSPKIVNTNKPQWFTVYCSQCLKESNAGKRQYAGHRVKLVLKLQLELPPRKGPDPYAGE